MADNNPLPASAPLPLLPTSTSGPSPLPAPPAPSPDSHNPQAVVATSFAHSLSLSLPLVLSSNKPVQFPNSLSTPPDRHSREDCWSEGATNTLIEAWGDRYLDLNRGNLKQKHWKDVADAVNARENSSKPIKTDVQCKNRLDTLKKKYKLEKSKIVTGGGPSKWMFYEKLDELIGPSKKSQKKTSGSPVEITANGKQPAEETSQKLVLYSEIKANMSNHLFNNINHLNNSSLARNNINNMNPNNHHTTTDTLSKSKESPDMTDSCTHILFNGAEGKAAKKRRLFDSPFKDLARAILKFGEVYERVESAKQQQLIDLEIQRMEFTKDLELQRMHLFMQTQVELAKMKHARHGT